MVLCHLEIGIYFILNIHSICFIFVDLDFIDFVFFEISGTIILKHFILFHFQILFILLYFSKNPVLFIDALFQEFQLCEILHMIILIRYFLETFSQPKIIS